MKYNNPRQLLSHETTWWDFKWKNSPNIFAFFFSAEMLTLQSWPVLVLSHPLPAHDKVKASQMLTVAKMYLWYYCGIYPVCAWGQTCPSGPADMDLLTALRWVLFDFTSPRRLNTWAALEAQIFHSAYYWMLQVFSAVIGGSVWSWLTVNVNDNFNFQSHAHS